MKYRIPSVASFIITSGLVHTLAYTSNFIAYMVFKRIGKKTIEFKINNYRMFINLDDPGISKDLYIFRVRVQQLKYILEKEIKEGDVILDIGANIGYYALMEKNLVGQQGTVYSLEPSPLNYYLLQKNVRLNKAESVIYPFKLAGGAKASKEKLYTSEFSNLNTFMPDLYKCGKKSKAITDSYVWVDVVDMTFFLKDKKNIDLIRMDIEGSEVEVLEGLTSAIKSGIFLGKIVFECHFPKYDDERHSMRKQLTMLFQNGYYAKIMTSNDEKKTHFHKRNYKPDQIVPTGIDRCQGIYYGISNDDAEYFICDVGGVRDVLFEKR